MMNDHMPPRGISRRRLLAGSGGAAALAALEAMGLFVSRIAETQAQQVRRPVYWDPEGGVDAPDRGLSEDRPLKTLEYCLRRFLANDRRFLQKRGTTYRMSGATMPHGMLGAFVGGAQNVTFSSYGNAKARPRIVCADAVESVFYFKDVSGWTVEGYELDGGGVCRLGLIQVRASARDVKDGMIVDCDIHHSAGHGIYLHTANSVYPFTRLPVLGTVAITGVVSHHNRLHGFVHGGATDGINYMNCVAHHNGKSADGSGWHGFSALAHRQATGGYGPKNEIPWENMGSNVWRIPIFPGQGAGIHRVSSRIGSPYAKLRKNTATPTMPHPGEFGVLVQDNVLRWLGGDKTSSGYLYVNVGDKDVGRAHRHNFYYAYTESKNSTYVRCIAHHNHDGSSRHGYIEGTGFQFDDFSSDGKFISCLSYQNEGCGFQFNMGDNNQLIGCIAWGNDSFGLLVQKHTGARIVNNVLDHNSVNALGRRKLAVENAITNDSVGTLLINNIVAGNLETGILFASGSEPGSVSRNNCVFGFAKAGLGGAVSATILADPMFVAHAARDYRLRPGSPCIAAGADPGFAPTTFDGHEMSRPYDIGAYAAGAAKSRPAVEASGDSSHA